MISIGADAEARAGACADTTVTVTRRLRRTFCNISACTCSLGFHHTLRSQPKIHNVRGNINTICHVSNSNVKEYINTSQFSLLALSLTVRFICISSSFSAMPLHYIGDVSIPGFLFCEELISLNLTAAFTLKREKELRTRSLISKTCIMCYQNP